MGNSEGRSGPLTFDLVIISNHGLPLGSLDCLYYIVGNSVGSSNLIDEKVEGSGQLHIGFYHACE